MYNYVSFSLENRKELQLYNLKIFFRVEKTIYTYMFAN